MFSVMWNLLSPSEKDVDKNMFNDDIKGGATSLVRPLVPLLMTWLLCGEPLSPTVTRSSAGGCVSSVSLVSIAAWGASTTTPLVKYCCKESPGRKVAGLFQWKG